MFDFLSTVLIFSVLISVYHYRGKVGEYLQRQAGGWASCHCPECRKRAVADQGKATD